MKKNALFIIMLATLLGFSFSAEKGTFSLIVPSAMASDNDSRNKDDIKNQDSPMDSNDDGEDASDFTCTCPPGITTCICPDGSSGRPSTGSLSTVPGSLRSVYGK